jgi:hypothetical protein
VLLGRTDLLDVDISRKLVECHQDAMQEIALDFGHSFLRGDAVLARVIFPTAQDFDLLLFREGIVSENSLRRTKDRSRIEEGLLYINRCMPVGICHCESSYVGTGSV